MSVKQIFNTSAELDYPTVLPTLDLDFANSKTLDPRITFTRASGGSYVGADGLIKLAGVNEARFDHDPYTGESLGLLIEESRTNLVLRSEEFDDAGWVKSAATVTPNAATAPNGTNTADKLIETATTTAHYAQQVATVTSGIPYTLSVFAKAGERSALVLLMAQSTSPFTNHAVVDFDLTNGTIISTSTGSGTITPSGNGWYRCTVTGTTSSTGEIVRYSFATVGDGISGIFIWGAQLEEGAFPTSYIPTEASTRTRAADSASITGKNFSDFYRQDEGTIFSNINFYAATGNVAGYKITQGTNLRGLGVQYTTSNTSFVARTVASVFYAIDGPAYSKKVAGRYKIGYSVDASIDGSVPVSSFSTSDPVFGTENQMDIGGARSLSGSNNKFNGTINRLTYYPKVLTPSQLQTLTS